MKNIVVKWVLGIAFLIAFNVCLLAYGLDNPFISFISGALVGIIIRLSED